MDHRVARYHAIEKVRDALNSCTTVKQLHSRYPEFAKYFPAVPTKETASVPAIPTGNIIECLKKAGWKGDNGTKSD